MAQTTSVNCNGSYGIAASSNMPATAFSWQVRFNFLSLSSSNPYQNVLAVSFVGGAFIQVYLDTGSGDLRIFSAAGSDVLLMSMTGREDAWHTLGMRWDGATASVSVWLLDDATDTWTELTITGTAAAQLGQIEVGRYASGAGEEPNQLLVCTGILRSGFMTQAECTSQALTDVPSDLSAGSAAVVNRYYKLDTAANGHIDSSANVYNASPTGTATTASNVPYAAGALSISLDFASNRPKSFDASMALGTPQSLLADVSRNMARAYDVAVTNGTPLAVSLDVSSNHPRGFDVTTSLVSGQNVSLDFSSNHPKALSPSLALGTPLSTSLDFSSNHSKGYGVTLTNAAPPGDYQTTSVNSDNQYALQCPWDDHMPPAAFTLYAWFKVGTWTSSDPEFDEFQNIMAVNCRNGYLQIYADAGSGTKKFRLWQGEEAPVTEYAINDDPEYTGWAAFAFRNDGLGGDTEVVMLREGFDPIVVSTIDLGDLRQFYVVGLIIVPEQAYDVDTCTVICWAEYKDNTFLQSQMPSSVPISYSSINRFYPFDDAATAHIDQSGNGWNANPAEIGVTVEESPYSAPMPEFGGEGVEAASEVGTGALAQNHKFQGMDVDAASEVGDGAFTQKQVLSGTGVEATSETGSGALAQNHQFGGIGAEATSEVGDGTLQQRHAFSGSGAEAASEVGTGDLGTSDLPDHLFGGVDAEAASEVGTGALAITKHAFGGSDAECASEVGTVAIAQNHRFGALSVEAASEVGYTFQPGSESENIDMAFSFSEVITGAPPAADSAPTVVAPAAARILKSPRRRSGFSGKAILLAVNGTSIPVTPWCFDEQTQTWFRLAAAITCAAGTASTVDVPENAKLFFQNGTATGAVTARAVGFM